MNRRGMKIFMMTAMILMGMLACNTKIFAATAVEENGALKVSGTKLVSRKTGKEVVLRGVSTHGINWDVGYPYISKEAFKTLRDNYGVNAVRLAMYTTEYYGYCDKGSAGESQEEVQAVLKQRIDVGVQAATELGMYVIIDWHVLHDLNPRTYQSQAKAFFKEMSQKYASYDNVLYEICNEPNGGTSWEDIRTYAKAVIPVIQKNDKDAVIIVGTPNWSQDVDVASLSPLPYENTMYTLHFYSATHTEYYREKLRTALANGLPVMVTEFGVSEASGDGSMNLDEAKTWLDLLDQNKISYFAWSLSNKPETASLLSPYTTKTSGWKKGDLSTAGQWVFGQYKTRSGVTAKAKKPAKVTGVTVKNIKGRKLKVSFKKVKGANGYQLVYSTKKGFKNAKKLLINKNGYTVKKLKKKKTYYVKVRAYKKVNGKKKFGAFSAVKKIKIKK